VLVLQVMVQTLTAAKATGIDFPPTSTAAQDKIEEKISTAVLH